MTVLSSKPTINFHPPKGRAFAGAAAAVIAVGVTLGVIFATGGNSTLATGGLTPLAPNTDVTPGTVQLEPGDTPPPGGDTGATMLAGGPGISIADAIASTLSGPLLVNGAVVIVDGEARLCSALAKSFPPQCRGDSLSVIGLDGATLDLQTEGKVSWTNNQAQLLGFVSDGVRVIDDASLAAGGGALPLPADGPGLGPAVSPADVSTLTFGAAIDTASFGPAVFHAEEDLSFECAASLQYDFEASTISATIHIDAFEAQAAVQGEDATTVTYTVRSGAIDLVAEPANLDGAPFAPTIMPVRSAEPVRIVATKDGETATFNASLVGTVLVTYSPYTKLAFISVSLTADEMPAIFGFVSDVSLSARVQLTAEQRGILEANQVSK